MRFKMEDRSFDIVKESRRSLSLFIVEKGSDAVAIKLPLISSC